MPSWNEKPVVVPTVNVNLTPCTTAYTCRNGHLKTCPGAPILIPLSLEPFRSVTFTVRLGECTGCPRPVGTGVYFNDHHLGACPARPIRVSCSISGKTWEESEVGDIEPVDSDPMKWSWAQGTNVGNAARERWALVKALVLGQEYPGAFSTHMDLFGQRDAVYAALADMARDEDLHEANRHALFAACPAIFPKAGVSPRPREDRPSARNLAAYVEHTVEQVGVMS